MLPLPIAGGAHVRLLGPTPGDAATLLDVVTRLDQPHGALQAVYACMTDAAGNFVAPLEAWLVIDPDSVPPQEQLPASAFVPRLQGWQPTDDSEALLAAQPLRDGPLLYCRKRHLLFVARSKTGAPLVWAQEFLDARERERIRREEGADAAEKATIALDPALAFASAPVGSDPEALDELYAFRVGTTPLGAALAHDDLLAAQGGFDALPSDAGGTHGCVGCSERARCYPEGENYGFAVDRLVVLGGVPAPLALMSVGAWRWREVGRVVGGERLSALASASSDDPLVEFRTRQAHAFDAALPRILAGESDGRELLEAARIKLGHGLAALAQLCNTWRDTQLPHLCWNDDTIRVGLGPLSHAGAAWGFEPRLRKRGIQPRARLPEFATPASALPAPPLYTDESLLPIEARDAMRHFGIERAAGGFIKSAESVEGGVTLHVVVEGVDIRWERFCAPDVITLVAEDWQATLHPASERNVDDDGDGLPLTGLATGAGAAALADGGELTGTRFTWYPRFGEALDLHALGVLLLEALLATDERSAAALRESLAEAREDLTRVLGAVPLEQREDRAAAWIADLCDPDTPASVWSRRNVFYSRTMRNETKLERFPAILWQAAVMLAFRLTTNVAGFSYCAARSDAAPRLDGGEPLPLIELRGLVAWYDDHLWSRRHPGDVVHATLTHD